MTPETFPLNDPRKEVMVVGAMRPLRGQQKLVAVSLVVGGTGDDGAPHLAKSELYLKNGGMSLSFT